MGKKTTLEVSKHVLVPKHKKASEKEKKELQGTYSQSLKELPRILITDPAISSLDVKEGDVIRIERNSFTAGTAVFYRRVVNV
ncbi:TPA: DNA-directed RNA polymerase subunit H [Candidatus Woesearchaeota archaeon]|nr:DNA-directed RNA polymerase subunit H [Candidatus Woesearchaeota archaeon]